MALANHEYHLPAASDSPQRSLERQERRLQVLTAIDKLSHDLRECVILRDHRQAFLGGEIVLNVRYESAIPVYATA
jgi:hypothetical protein